jgi:phenylpropionate dioxygenase-like ring-hydroxylating dioxygenase large terminal subunit
MNQARNVPQELVSNLKKCIAPAAEAVCLPPACYTDDAVLQTEMTHIFRRHWLGIGHAGRFKAAGDYETLELAGVPLIVLRDKEGVLRAFANTCRHRGARLLDGEGNCQAISCPFHKWTYRLDGTLIGATQSQQFSIFDRTDHGLVQFRAAEDGGFAFVCLDKTAAELPQQLGDFASLHAPWPLDSLVPTKRRTFTVQCNWKNFLEVFNEYYHLPYVHPDSISDVYSLPDQGDKVTGAYASQYGGTDGTGGLLEGQQEYALPEMPKLDETVRNGVRYTWLFPNMTFAASSDALWIYEANPIDAKSCQVTQTVCFPQAVTELDNFAELAQWYYQRMDAAIEEDIPALENQLRGLNSPFAKQGPFSPLLEANVAAFANWYARQMLAT